MNRTEWALKFVSGIVRLMLFVGGALCFIGGWYQEAQCLLLMTLILEISSYRAEKS